MKTTTLLALAVIVLLGIANVRAEQRSAKADYNERLDYAIKASRRQHRPCHVCVRDGVTTFRSTVANGSTVVQTYH